MRIVNRLVRVVLSSRLHPVLSGSTALVRYAGRRSGRVFTAPVQYAAHGEVVVILVGRPESKTWWRNFTAGHDAELLLAGRWLPVTARAVTGDEEPARAAELLAVYRSRFPRAGKGLSPARTVMIRCRPR